MALSLALGHALLVAVYVLTAGGATLGVALYTTAYIEMKRSRIILGVLLMGVAVLIEAVYFGTAETARLHWPPLYEVLKGPWLKLIPKGMMLGAVTFFITASVAKDGNDIHEATKHIGGKRP